jgi:hypothetical protein
MIIWDARAASTIVDGDIVEIRNVSCGIAISLYTGYTITLFRSDLEKIEKHLKEVSTERPIQGHNHLPELWHYP